MITSLEIDSLRKAMVKPNRRIWPVLLLTLSLHNLSFDSVPAQLKIYFVALCNVYLMVCLNQ